METQKISDSKAILKNVQCWWYHNSHLQTILQSHKDKNSMVLAENRHEDQWVRIEDLDINSHSYSQVIFDKVAQSMMEKR
jgi:hypothetical protein